MSGTRLRLIPLTLTILLIGACVTQPLATDGSAVVAADEGLMAVRFVSNWKGNESALFEEMAFGVTRDGASTNEVLEMRSNDDAQLIALQAGRYTWFQATIGTNYIRFDSDATFTISPDEITYVGDITLLVTSKPFILIMDELSVENNQDETLSRLRLDYGALLDDYSLSVQIAELDRSYPARADVGRDYVESGSSNKSKVVPGSP